MPNYDNIATNLAGATQAKMRRDIAKYRMENAPTRKTFRGGNGTSGRTESGSLAGLRIPYNRNLAHGSSALDPYLGQTSLEPYIAPLTSSMYVGLAFRGFTLQTEWFHEIDMAKGNMSVTKDDLKRQVQINYEIEGNWWAIGDDFAMGSVAVVTVGGGSGTITLAYDNNGRNRTKGSAYLKVSYSTDADKRIVYESYNPATDAKTATFYITAKASMTSATVVVTDAGTIGANNVIVLKGHYKKVPYGIGYHTNPSMTQYQGANVSLDTFIKPTGIDAADQPINPSMINSAKSALMTDANDVDARFNRVIHLTISNQNALAAYDYDLRTIEAKDGFKGTHGIPFSYKDEDSYFAPDANYIESEVDIRDRESYFEYRLTELREVTKDPQQYVGANLVGSTEFYQNWGEAYNLAFDGRGSDGQNSTKGKPNSAVRIYNIQFPTDTQVSRGRSVV